MTIKTVLRVAALSVVVSGLCLLALTALHAQPDATGPTAAATGPKISFTMRIDPALLARLRNLKVYKLKPPKINQDKLELFIRTFFPNGLKGEPIGVGSITARSDAANPANFIMLDTKSGLFSMSRGMADQIDDKPGELPDDAKAASLALSFLKQNGLGPANPREMVLARVGHIRSRSFNPRTGAEGPICDQMLTVNFSRLVDGTEVVGAASKMIVQIGDGGQVVGAGINWRELGDGSVIPAKSLRTPEQLERDIRVFLARELKLASAVDIRQIGLFYYDNGGEFLQPAIGYEALVREGRQTLRYFGQTALLLTPPERVGPGGVSTQMREAIKLGSPETKPPTLKGD